MGSAAMIYVCTLCRFKLEQTGIFIREKFHSLGEPFRTARASREFESTRVCCKQHKMQILVEFCLIIAGVIIFMTAFEVSELTWHVSEAMNRRFCIATGTIRLKISLMYLVIAMIESVK